MTIVKRCLSLFRKYPYLIGVILTMIIGASILFQISPGYMGDEAFHTLQTKRIFRGDNRFVKELTTIPGYHYTLAYIGRLTDPIVDYGKHPKTRALRIFQLVLSLLLPIVLFLIIKELKQKREITLILVITPILFPFLFLVYTDIFSLTLFLIAFLFHIRGRYDLAGLFMLLDIIVRQDNIIWVVFFLVLLFYEIYDKNKRFNRETMISFLSKSMSYVIVIFVFSIFYIFNGGVAIGDKSAHPSMSFHFDNVWLFFAMFSFLFLPIVIFQLKKIIQLFFQNKIISLLFVVGGYFLFTATFVVSHPYNSSVNEYLHNAIAKAIVMDVFLGLVTYFLIVLSVGYITVQKFSKKIFILVIPFSLLALSLHWMVEFRYLFIPLSLLLLTLNHDTRAMRYQMIYSGILSVIIFYFLFVSESIFL